MRPAFFGESEAHSHIGDRVQALRDFPCVPAGTSGKVVRARKVDNDHWMVRVEWALPRRVAVHFATLLHLSFNLQTQSKPITDDFSKDEFERLLVSSHSTSA
jgi:hypothetical protein